VVKGYFGFLSDITEQKRAEDALRESEVRFRQLAENIREVFWLRSGDGRELIYVSPAYEKIWQRSCASLYERPASLIEAIHPDDRQFVQEAFASALAEKREFDKEYRILRPDDSIRWIRDRGFPVHDAHGGIHRIAGIAEDITRWKSVEEQLRSNQKQLRSLASEVSLAEERERRRIAADLHDQVGQMLALAKIKLGGHQELLSTHEQLASIREVRDLLEDAIRDTRSLHLELSPPVLHELGFESAVEWLCERTQKLHNIVCDMHDDGQTKPVGDEVRVVLFQAIRELLFNVAKHAQISQADVSLTRVGDTIQVRVQDAGVGFDPRLVNSQVTGKHGIGLFRIRERVRFFGGGFDVKSHPGKGTCVTITAPVKLD
jgi:PAS domain S-box-containing protein